MNVSMYICMHIMWHESYNVKVKMVLTSAYGQITTLDCHCAGEYHSSSGALAQHDSLQSSLPSSLQSSLPSSLPSSLQSSFID